MQDLIKIEQTKFGGTETNSVSARELWKNLKIDTKFTDWIKRKLEELGAIENIDYIVFLNFEKNSEGRPEQDYIITTDIAKHICMLRKDNIGKQCRQHIMDEEKRLRLIIEDKIAKDLDEMKKQMRKQQVLLEHLNDDGTDYFAPVRKKLRKIIWEHCERYGRDYDEVLNLFCEAVKAKYEYEQEVTLHNMVQHQTESDLVMDLKVLLFKLSNPVEVKQNRELWQE